tara:strand:+ start:748 stop:975 length:228 start_codon:yes stop_codon:yes gene_type:complete
MLGDDEIKEMQEQINAMEQDLAERKKELHEAKYAGLRSAMEARKAAEDAVRQELRSLGVSTISSLPSPWNGLWRI